MATEKGIGQRRECSFTTQEDKNTNSLFSHCILYCTDSDKSIIVSPITMTSLAKMKTRLSEEKQTFKCIDKPDIPLESFIGSFPSEYLDSEDALIVYENGDDEIVLYQSVNENSSPTKDTSLPTKDTSQLVVKGEERLQLLQYINKYAHVADCRVIKEEFVSDEVLPSMNVKNSISKCKSLIGKSSG